MKSSGWTDLPAAGLVPVSSELREATGSELAGQSGQFPIWAEGSVQMWTVPVSSEGLSAQARPSGVCSVMWAGICRPQCPAPLRSWSFARLWQGPGGDLGEEEGGLGPVTVTLAAAAAVGSDPEVLVPLLKGPGASRAGFPLDVRALATLSGLQPLRMLISGCLSISLLPIQLCNNCINNSL